MIDFVAVVMIFSIPIIAIVTSHFQKQTKLKAELVKDEIELEKLKYQNYLVETEKMRLELQQMTPTQNNRDTFDIK